MLTHALTVNVWLMQMATDENVDDGQVKVKGDDDNDVGNKSPITAKQINSNDQNQSDTSHTGLQSNSTSRPPNSTSQESQNSTSQEQSNQQDATGNPGATGLFGYNPLHGAASNGFADLLKSLLTDDSSKVDVNGKTVDGGYTPLHLAASAGHADCVDELLQHPKINMHVTDAFGRTPLETAEQNFKTDVAKLLQSHSKNLYVLILVEYTVNNGSYTGEKFCGFHGFSTNRKSFSY